LFFHWVRAPFQSPVSSSRWKASEAGVGGAAGFAAGLLAGGAGAWVYAFHCTESGLPFITLWYSAGILATALLGAVIGRWLLRW
jgi:hypothetical protein